MADKTTGCPSCALPIDPKVDECPYCGYELPKQRNSVIVAAIAFVLLMILWAVF